MEPSATTLQPFPVLVSPVHGAIIIFFYPQQRVLDYREAGVSLGDCAAVLACVGGMLGCSVTGKKP